MTQTARQLFSFRDYTELEEESTVKHEFLDGWVWAMAGGSPEHAAVAVNVSTLLSNQLRGRPCRVFSADLRIRVKATGLATYPDISVICGKLVPDPDDPKGHTLLNPLVIVEVLNPSTAEYDRGEKLLQYQQIDTIEEIVLVSHETRQVDVWRPVDGQQWEREVFVGEETARLRSLGCELPLVEVYYDPLDRLLNE